MATNNLGGALRRKIYTTPRVLEKVTSKNRPASHVDQPKFPRGQRSSNLESGIRSRLPARDTGLESGIRSRLPGAQQLAPGASTPSLESGIRSRLAGRQIPGSRLPQAHPDPAAAISGAQTSLESGLRGRLVNPRIPESRFPQRYPDAAGAISAAQPAPPPRAGAWQGGQTPDTRATWQASEGFHPFGHVAADPSTWGGDAAQRELISAPWNWSKQTGMAPPTLSPLAEEFRSARSMADQISAQQSEAGRSSLGVPFSLGEAEGAQPLPEDSPLRNPLYSTPTELPPEDEEALQDDSPQTPEEIQEQRAAGAEAKRQLREGLENDYGGSGDDAGTGADKGLDIDTVLGLAEEVVDEGGFTWEQILQMYDEYGFIPIESGIFSGSDVGEWSVLSTTGDHTEWFDGNTTSRGEFIDSGLSWEDLLNPKNETHREKAASIRLRALMNRPEGANSDERENIREGNYYRFQQIEEMVDKGWTSYQEQEWLMKNGMYINEYGQVAEIGSSDDPEDDRIVFNLEPNEKGREFTHEQLAQALELDPTESLMPKEPEPESEKGEYGYEKGSVEDEMMRALFESPLPTHSDRDIEAEKAKIRQANAGVYQDALRTAGYQNLMMGGSPDMAMGTQADMMRRVGTASAQQEMAREFQLRDENFRTQIADAERKFGTLRDIAMMHREDELGSLAFKRSIRMNEYMDGLKRDYQTWYHNNFVPPQWMQALGAFGGAIGTAGTAFAGGYLGQLGKQQAM